jgi:hypothetical protein
MKIGHSLSEGLALGTLEKASAVYDAARHLSKKALAHLKAELKTRARELKQLTAQLIIGNLVAGLESTIDKIKSTSQKMVSSIMYAWKHGLISKSKASSLLTWLRDDTDKLKDLATKRDKVAATIAAAKAFRDSTRDNAIGFANITGLGETSSSTDMLGKMRDKLAALKDFAANMGKLAKAGLNQTSLRQLFEAGPDAAAQMAGELANGPANILAQINATQGQINSVAQGLGMTGADALYDSGKNAGKGFLTGLMSQEKQFQAAMDKLGKSMVASLRKALGVKSGAALGDHLVRGVAFGHSDHAVKGLTHGHGKAISKGAALKVGGGAHGKYQVHPASGADRPLEVHVFLDGKQIQASVQKHTLRTAKRNPTNGLTPR